MNRQMAYCAPERAPATVESAFVLLKNGTFQENSATVMTGTATNMMGSFAQGMGSVAVETVNAGTDGTEMPVKSGSARNTLNNYVAGNRVLLSSRPSERINAEETMYNHHYNRSNKTIVCFSLSECLNEIWVPIKNELSKF